MSDATLITITNGILLLLVVWFVAYTIIGLIETRGWLLVVIPIGAIILALGWLLGTYVVPLLPAFI